MISNIANGCQKYYNEIPNDTLMIACKSAVCSFTASTILKNFNSSQILNLRDPLLATGMAFVASLIHSTITPLFHKMFGDEFFNVFRDISQFLIVKVATQSLVHTFTSFTVDLVRPSSNFAGVIFSQILPNDHFKTYLPGLIIILRIWQHVSIMIFECFHLDPELFRNYVNRIPCMSTKNLPYIIT